MDDLMQLYRKNVRVNDFWKKYTHAQIDIAHRILEYLEPDAFFRAKDLNEDIMTIFKTNNVVLAVKSIIDELGIDTSDDYNSLQTEARKFAEEVLKDFNAKRKQDKMKERDELLARLTALDKELGIEETVKTDTGNKI